MNIMPSFVSCQLTVVIRPLLSSYYVFVLVCPQFPHTNNTHLAAVVAVEKWETPWAFSKQAGPASFPRLAFAANSAGVM
jgi:hypothetical protein